MKITQTRHGVFETNSSSTHSISIHKSTLFDTTLYVDEDGVCTITPGKFGWEMERYTDAGTKASYCLTYCWRNGDSTKLDMLREVIQFHTNCKNVQFVQLDGYSPEGYIDHQSSDVAEDAFESKNALRAFIFNSRSVLTTDNDNH